MDIYINGQCKQLVKPLALKALVENFCQNPQYVIAELNGEIIKKDSWGNRWLNDKDRIELVSFVGGG